ncbi:MAG: winged helix-turn-helix domain-containing protein, partial [Gammaproteobacteria bacterium]|nr:winged helix-turn-helix domain-containing protein [Gammaproteobacteria bacterium]
MKHNLQRGFTLGDFHIRPLQGQVVGPTGTHHLHPKAIEVLLCLAGTPGELVQRDDLVREVWGDSTVGEEALTRCIGELRHALDDHRDDPRYIQTLPKRGYRLIGDLVCDHGYTETTQDPRPQGALAALWVDLKKRNVVRVALAYSAISWVLLQFAEVMIEALKLPDWSLRVFVVLLGVGFLVAVIVAWVFQVVPEKDFEDPARRRHLMHYVEIAIIGGLAIAVGLLFYRQFIDQPLFPEITRLSPELTSPEPSEKSVAITRLDNFGGDSSFSNGLGEHLVNLLARSGDLEVPSRKKTWALSDEGLAPVDIAKALGVRYVLEGSVQQKNQRIRVTAQLIDGSSGNHVWSETYDELLSAENFFNIQDLIAHQVVNRLAGIFSLETELENAKRGTKNDGALRLYLLGREQLNKPKTKESLAAAISAFAESIQNDPYFAEAHAGLCEAKLAA